ncbi:nuclear transport factor 2 family protein [Rhizosphaericola mali]|uniref:Nuclear transport factor 2 family protein n=1 Tax=Rhizosphaericola mali TaxID=2545455 RepID=A0A5P2G0G3_9BACT|nr:nuclear transport factor 2 family protein [Rhizosphaericola mali]QES88138.1 nuclear transport factor 2 family protein [Rhizosphaericola mali]
MALKFKNISDEILDIYKDLFEAEKEREAAMITGNVEVLQKLLAEDAIYIHSSAKVDNTQSYIAPILAKKVRYDVLEIEISRIININENKIVLLYGQVQIEALLEGSYTKLDNLFTMIWKLENNQWVMYSWQSTKKL